MRGRSLKSYLTVALFLVASPAAALTPHDKSPGVQAKQEANGSVHIEAQAQRNEGGSSIAPTLVTPTQPERTKGDAEKQSDGGEQEGTEFWPTFLGRKIKISDSAIILLTGVLALYTMRLWRSTEKLWTAGERQIKLIGENAEAQANDTAKSLRISSLDAKAAQKAAKVAERTLIASYRPWLKLDVKFGVQPLSLSEDGIMTSVNISVQNVGNIPATRVDPLRACTLCHPEQEWMYIKNTCNSVTKLAIILSSIIVF